MAAVAAPTRGLLTALLAWAALASLVSGMLACVLRLRCALGTCTAAVCVLLAASGVTKSAHTSSCDTRSHQLQQCEAAEGGHV